MMRKSMKDPHSPPKTNMDVSETSGTPKSSILIGFSIINHPFWGTPIFGNTHIASKKEAGLGSYLPFEGKLS